jgi:hypothetical protein
MSSFCGAAVLRVESEMLICLILATLWLRVMALARAAEALQLLY